jgi:hypothetical protein
MSGGINTSTTGGGDAGDISIEAGSLELDSGGIFSESRPFFDIDGTAVGGQGKAGTIDIKARDAIRMSLSSISTSASGGGVQETSSLKRAAWR